MEDKGKCNEILVKKTEINSVDIAHSIIRLALDQTPQVHYGPDTSTCPILPGCASPSNYKKFTPKASISKSEHAINNIAIDKEFAKTLGLSSISFGRTLKINENATSNEGQCTASSQQNDLKPSENCIVDVRNIVVTGAIKDAFPTENSAVASADATSNNSVRPLTQNVILGSDAMNNAKAKVHKPIGAKKSEPKKPDVHFIPVPVQRDSLSSIGSNVCRICMTRGRERLISPCHCKGSLANVHLSCLERWLNQVGRNHCELCGFSYPAIRTPRYTIVQALRLWFGNPRNRSHLQSDCLIFWLLSTVTAGLLAVCIVGTQYFVIEGNKFGKLDVGFAFGAGDANKPPAFGAAASGDNKGFSFTSPTAGAQPAFGAGAPAPVNFSLGNAQAKTTASTMFSPSNTQSSGLNFDAAAKTPGFGGGFGGFGAPPNQTVSPFGQTASPAQAGATATPGLNLTFGGTAPATAQPALGFGQTTTSAAPPTGLVFGSPTGGALGGFSGFQTPTSGFSAPQQTAPATAAAPASTPAFGFGASSALGFKTPASAATGLGFGSLGSSPATGGLSFGAATTTAGTGGMNFGAATTTAAGGLNFGAPAGTLGGGLNFGAPATSSSGGLNFGAPASTASGAFATPASGFGAATTITPVTPNFGSTPSSIPSTGLSLGSVAPASSQGGINFGNIPTSLGAKPAGLAPATAPGGLNFGAPTTSVPASIGFGAPPATTSVAAAFGTAPASTAGTALNFGAPVSAPAGALSFKPPTAATTAPSSAGTGFQLGAKMSSAGLPGFSLPTSAQPASSIATSAAATSITALGKPAAATTQPTTTPSLTAATSITAAAPPLPIASLTFAQLEDNINKWTLDLEEQEKLFINQATQVNAWDRLLIANGEKIVELNEAVQVAKSEQQGLEHEIDFILGQQRELEELLAPLEKGLERDQNSRVRDPEREHMYQLAESLDTQLKQMSGDLKEVIEHVNSTSHSQDDSDPIVQIGRILDAHMNSMQWVDRSIGDISTKLDQLKVTHDTLRRDNERSFTLTYN